MGTSQYAGDAIAHDLRSPLSRLRSKLGSRCSTSKDPSQAHDALAGRSTKPDQCELQTVSPFSRLQAADTRRNRSCFRRPISHHMASCSKPSRSTSGHRVRGRVEPNVRVSQSDSWPKPGQSRSTSHQVHARRRRDLAPAPDLAARDRVFDYHTGPGVPAMARGRIKERSCARKCAHPARRRLGPVDVDAGPPWRTRAA